MPDEAHPTPPCTIAKGWTREATDLPDGTHRITRTLGRKKLVRELKDGHPVKYAVASEDDAATLLDMWLSCEAVQTPAAECAQSHQNLMASLGDDGISSLPLAPSPVQELIEQECGVETFYYLLHDHPELMRKLIDAMHAIRCREYEITAETSPFDLAIAEENTSTLLTSPEIYRRYSLPHIRDYSDIMHSHGKLAIVHMCGHLRGLLPILKETGMDGIHALTPPPIGDCSFEAALDAMGDDLIIIGAMDGTILHHPHATPDDIKTCVKNTLTPRIRASRFVLWPVTDGIPTQPWRLEAVRDAIYQYGGSQSKI